MATFVADSRLILRRAGDYATRTGMLGSRTDYIRTARAKGLARVVLFKHALRNAVIPVVSLAAVQFGFMLGGSIVVETIFALHGAGFWRGSPLRGMICQRYRALFLFFSFLYRSNLLCRFAKCMARPTD